MEMPPIFYEVHSNLPREGPGDNQSTKRAFKMLKNLPANPLILDIGCGPGMQTIEVAKLSGGQIIALDNHQPFLDQLNFNAKKAGISDKIKTVKGDMFNLQYLKKSFDLVWCEGAIFIIGFAKGLTEWRPLLANKGYLVLSELTWLRTDRPRELAAYMKEMYEGLGEGVKTIEENVETAKKAGYQVITTFILPKKSWFDNYYMPIEAKLPSLKAKHKGDPEALQYFAAEEKEIEMFRRYNNYYGYVFYLLQIL
ncbi:MAG: class I SAM-dependent methyltransferase [Candidatus Bathyarchaeota archaeon]|nr:class I SAM-dependent methyltransferase [Candidatus Bathyarchaeota archaeon]